MNTRQYVWRAQVKLETEICNCVPDLAIYHRDRTLPCIPTVYILVNEADEILYVGHSNNLRRRIAQHTNAPRMQRLNWTHILFFEPQIRDVAQRLETEAILTARACPVGNQMISLRRTKEARWIELKKSPFIVSDAVRKIKIGTKKYTQPPASYGKKKE